MAESVKVAVRVRPFNGREIDRGSKCCIKMQNSTTTITNLDDASVEPKVFTFDYSYWSHDGSMADGEGISVPEEGSNYASQRMVFDDLGQGVLNNAYEGFNTSLFAYGQTGAGKSYSMVGYGANKGIVPITCDELFITIEGNKDASIKYCVSISMLEIYNEQVRDLLIKTNPKGGLPVRQNPSIGAFYVQGLSKAVVGSYKEIEKKMEEGTSNRTVAATAMNATSSRAHTVVTIQFDQVKKNEVGEETKRTSVINLVDLAGSERAGSTGATGDRLKEGANINKSLSSLGNVISALAEASGGGKKKIVIPYRDSVLTKLLQNALGGNSKTIMIAALSPADINYDETLGTLRYADRAKQIKNKAVVNENPMDKLIRELKEENEKLKKAMGGELPMAVEGGGGGMTAEEAAAMRKQMEEEIRAQMEANMAAMTEMQQPFEDRTLQAQQQFNEGQLQVLAAEKERDTTAHITNLNEDSMLSGVIHHLIKEGETVVGRKDKDSTPQICLSGLSIQKSHAIFTSAEQKCVIKPGVVGAKTKVNGQSLNGDRTLMHNDRILFGSNHMYVYYDPVNKEVAEGTPADITWDYAQREIAQAKGFQTGSDGQLNKEQQLAQEQVLELLPMVSESNAISEELNKHKSFEVILISGAANPAEGGKGTRVMVKMKNLLNGNTWLWERGQFMNRRYLMQDMYQRYLDGDETVEQTPQDEDPFWDPPKDVLIGTSSAFLQALGYGIDMDDPILITDYKGEDQGQMFINISPCDENGKCMGEEYFVEESSELLGKPYYYKVLIRSAEIRDSRFSVGSFIKYKLEGDEEFTTTEIVKGSLSPEFSHSRVIKIDKVTQETLEFFEYSCITFLLYGSQEDRDSDVKLAKLSTKELRQREAVSGNMKTNVLTRQLTKNSVDEASALKAEILLLKRRNEMLTKKEKRIQHIVTDWGKKPPEEQVYEPFYRAVSAAAFNTGTMLRSAATVITQVIKAQKLISNMNAIAANGGAAGATPESGAAKATGSKACSIM